MNQNKSPKFGVWLISEEFLAQKSLRITKFLIVIVCLNDGQKFFPLKNTTNFLQLNNLLQAAEFFLLYTTRNNFWSVIEDKGLNSNA